MPRQRRGRRYYYPHSTDGETERSASISRPGPDPSSLDAKLSATHILTLAGNLHLKPCSKQRVLRAWKQSKGFSWLKASTGMCPSGSGEAWWETTHSSSAQGLQTALQTHHLIPHLDLVPQFPQTPSQPPPSKKTQSFF